MTATRKPIVIAHRGASGYLPEHTLAGYFVAIQQGADYIEPDLVMTKDAVLVARHENAIAVLNPDGTVKEATTDVADRAEFAARCTTKVIDGVELTGWFTEDFTLAELKTLRCRERLPLLRPANAHYDGQFEIPTLEEILQLLSHANAMRRTFARQRGLPPPAEVGLYPETKHPSHFRGIGLPLEEALLAALRTHGYADATAPVFLQSFEVANLKLLRSLSPLPIIQLMDGPGQPWDFAQAGDRRRYADLITPAGLAEIATYANGIGVHKDMLIPRTADGHLGEPTGLVAAAHRAGLQVHAWTFRAENHFLPAEFRHGGGDAARGGLAAEVARFFALGVDGVFSDQTDAAVRALPVGQG